MALPAAALVAVLTAVGALRLHAAVAETGDATVKTSTVPMPPNRVALNRYDDNDPVA
ncbi:hypothetical protein ACNHUS_05455 [Actinomycetes bacterium M1A6_2h]